MKQTLSAVREKYLGMEQTTALKGLLALGVLVAHAAPASGVLQGSILSPLIGSLGYLCVAVFFFLSGYGIMAQYQLKKEQYLKSFLKNRVLSIYLLTVFLVLFYGIFHAVVGKRFSAFDVLHSLLIGHTIVNNGWYLQVVLLFYILWFLTTKYIQKPRVQFVVLCAEVLGYMCIGALLLSHTWYQSCLSFLLGVFWQQNKQKIDDWLFQDQKRIFALLVVAFGCFCATYLLSTKRLVENAVFDGIFRSVMACVSAPSFTILTVLLSIYVLWGNLPNYGVLRFLGKRSMEIYVLQGVALHTFKTGVFSVANGWLYIWSALLPEQCCWR